MLAGYLPFDEQDQMQLLRKIKNGTYTMAPHFSADAADLISRILVVDPRKRYTMSDIKIHAFFTRTIFRLPAGKKDASIEPNAE